MLSDLRLLAGLLVSSQIYGVSLVAALAKLNSSNL